MNQNGIGSVFAAFNHYLNEAKSADKMAVYEGSSPIVAGESEVAHLLRRAADLADFIAGTYEVKTSPANRQVEAREDNSVPAGAMAMVAPAAEAPEYVGMGEPAPKAKKTRQRRSSKPTGGASKRHLTDTSVAPASGVKGDRKEYTSADAARFAMTAKADGYTHAALLSDPENGEPRIVFFKGKPEGAVMLRRQPAKGQKTGNSIGSFTVEEVATIGNGNVAALMADYNSLTVNVAV